MTHNLGDSLFVMPARDRARSSKADETKCREWWTALRILPHEGSQEGRFFWANGGCGAGLRPRAPRRPPVGMVLEFVSTCDPRDARPLGPGFWKQKP